MPEPGERCPWTTTDLISATDNRGIYERAPEVPDSKLNYCHNKDGDREAEEEYLLLPL